MTAANDEHPTRRIVMVTTKGYAEPEPFVVEVRSRVLVMRPKGARRGGPQEVVVAYSSVFDHGLLARINAERATKGRARRRRG